MAKNICWIMLLLIPAGLSAQRFTGGLMAGLSASQVDGDSYAGFDKVGLQGGVFVYTLFTENFGAQMEIKYTGKGARKKTNDEDPAVYKLALHYIDLPLMVFYRAKSKYIFEAGLVPAYLFEAVGEDSGGKLPQEYMTEFKKFDLSWLIGFRYQVNKNISAGMRYSYSLISINEYPYTPPYYTWIGNLFGYNIGDYNNYLTFGIYYQFP